MEGRRRGAEWLAYHVTRLFDNVVDGSWSESWIIDHVIATVKLWFGISDDWKSICVIHAVGDIYISPKYSAAEVGLMSVCAPELSKWLGYKNPVCVFVRVSTTIAYDGVASVTVWKCEDPEGRVVAAKVGWERSLREEVQVLNRVFSVPGVDPETMMSDHWKRRVRDSGLYSRLLTVHPDIPTGIVRWIKYYGVPGPHHTYDVATGREQIDTLVMEHLESIQPDVNVVGSSAQFFQAARVLLQALVWLHETHTIVHGDIAPTNIMWRAEEGVPVLIDFGLANGPEGVRSNWLKSVVRGRPERVAPEMVEGRYTLTPWFSEDHPRFHLKLGNDHPSLDIWSLGGVFAEWLSGRTRPFTNGARVDWNDLGARVMVLAGQRSWVLEHKGAEFIRSHLTNREGWSNEDIEEPIGLMESMLALEPEARPSARNCLALLASAQ